MNHLGGFAGVAKKQAEMNASYLILIQFVEIHIGFHNNNYQDNIAATVGAAGVGEHIEGTEGHIDETVGHVDAVEETKGHVVEVLEVAAVPEVADERIDVDEGAKGHIVVAAVAALAVRHIEVHDIEDNDILDIENKNAEYLEEYYHLLLMIPRG